MCIRELSMNPMDKPGRISGESPEEQEQGFEQQNAQSVQKDTANIDSISNLSSYYDTISC